MIFGFIFSWLTPGVNLAALSGVAFDAVVRISLY